MKSKKRVRVLSLTLSLILMGCGCSSVPNTPPSTDTVIETTTAPTTDPSTQEEPETKEAAVSTEFDSTTTNSEEDESRSKEEIEQKNSFSMMYYLAITAEKIRTSRNNRLILEEIYTSLLNDINPGAVDEITQDHLKNLRDIIKSYLNISVKRERLQFIYNQSKAAAIRNAVPNPLSVFSLTQAFDWKKLAISVVYTAIDSYTAYKAARADADTEFLMSGWELDDEEIETIQKNRDRAFDYMVDMVQEYHLDGMKTLNEKAIEKFAEICAIESASEKIRRLVSEKDTYEYLGNYWLELADCYFETSQYLKCLECVDKYNELSTRIYRQDLNYAAILPKAIVAAQNTYSGEKYVSVIREYADAILDNTPKDNWSARYFAAQVYMDLYTKTSGQIYLRTAFDIIFDNVTILLQGQRDLNTTYINDVVEVSVAEPDYRFLSDKEKDEKEKEYKEEQKRVKKYNKALKEDRKTELPSLYEPLVLNCELLFALSKKLGISDAEKQEIEAILKTDSNGVFLVKPINDAYSFTNSKTNYPIEFSKDEIIIPADLLTKKSNIYVTVYGNGTKTTFDDCVVTEVERKGETIDTFYAHITSKKLKKYDWTDDATVFVEITYEDAYNKSASFRFSISEFQKKWYGTKVEFVQE